MAHERTNIYGPKPYKRPEFPAFEPRPAPPPEPEFQSRFQLKSKQWGHVSGPLSPSRSRPATKEFDQIPPPVSRSPRGFPNEADPQFPPPPPFLSAPRGFPNEAASEFPPTPPFLSATKRLSRVIAPKVPPPVAPKPKNPFIVAEPQFDPQQQDQDQQGGEMTLPPADPDPYVGCSLIPGLTMYNFWPYVNAMDAAFVMFYDPSNPMSVLAKLHIKGAAMRTKRPNHKYIAVDCSQESELCKMQGISDPPAYKLYSRGSLVGTYNDVENVRPTQIQKYVETVPVLGNPTPKGCKS